MSALRVDEVHASDEALGRLLVSDDPDALSELYARHAPAIHDYLLRSLRDRTAAEDATQLTFLNALEKRHALRDPARVKSWLFGIAHNIVLNSKNRSRAMDGEDALALVQTEGGPEQELDRWNAQDLVWAAAASLEPRQYQIIDLTLRRGLEDSAEVADLMGVPVARGYVLAHRAKEALGNAVGVLLLARDRGRCERLDRLIPDETRQLTTGQHRSIEHHLRRCEPCRGRKRSLTTAAELFAGLPLIALPRILQRPPRALTATNAAARVVGPARRFARARRIPRAPLALGATLAILFGFGGNAALHARPERPGYGQGLHPKATLRPAAVIPGVGASTAWQGLTAPQLLAQVEQNVRNASSYRINISSIPGSVPVAAAQLTVNHAGDWTGTLALANPPAGDRTVTLASGSLYVQGDGTAPAPYVNGWVIPDFLDEVFRVDLDRSHCTRPKVVLVGRRGTSECPPVHQPGTAAFGSPGALAAHLLPPGITLVTSQVALPGATGDIILTGSDGTEISVDAQTLLPMSVLSPTLGVVSLSGFNSPTAITPPVSLLLLP